ncbi:hypothetical protein [Microbulbifer taiwanensis]|uniref:hypothetical protein n=1 Tax=Microbulbifer taiwanensis TaxID=986746 RepID=UPI003672013A
MRRSLRSHYCAKRAQGKLPLLAALYAIMNSESLANKLSEIYQIDEWGSYCSNIPKEVKNLAFQLAEPMWVENMLAKGRLLVHPEVAEDLKGQNYKPNMHQKKMIWASILGSDETPDSEKRFYKIKKLLIGRYGEDWWEDVYQRKNNVWAARQRIQKSVSGSMISAFVENTILGAHCAREERQRALCMIKK